MSTTYVYIGTPYTSTTYYTEMPDSSSQGTPPSPYSPEMKVLGRFTTTNRLPANLSTPTSIAPAPEGANLMNDWQFNDGVIEYTKNNSNFTPLGTQGSPTISGATVTTDNLGNIVNYFFMMQSPQAPITVGQIFSSLQLSKIIWGNGEAIQYRATCIFPFPNGTCNASYVTAASPDDILISHNSTEAIWSSFDTLPDTGEAVSGTASTAIANIAANDGINGVPATLGSGANAIVAMQGTWPSGISLNADTGAVEVSQLVAPGSYVVEYQICDFKSPSACVTSSASLTIAPPTVTPPTVTSAPTPVPTLSECMLISLSALVAGIGLTGFLKRRSRY
ncbi:hypothetical protein [Comamonas odontotermitis]|uniref:hypothetical protein n=1 Tax=Comamonas odontotermitis TaxID=379895 RepID=UPI001CC58399|nr:hypothetical protein [Comamonas odontotermitis]UBB15352.1 hypothetical protein LAD35_10710 [Comamonas odontotermitis]